MFNFNMKNHYFIDSNRENPLTPSPLYRYIGDLVPGGLRAYFLFHILIRVEKIPRHLVLSLSLYIYIGIYIYMWDLMTRGLNGGGCLFFNEKKMIFNSLKNTKSPDIKFSNKLPSYISKCQDVLEGSDDQFSSEKPFFLLI